MTDQSDDEIGIYKCNRCGERKLFHQFNRDRKLKRGIRGHCKVCSAAANKNRPRKPSYKRSFIERRPYASDAHHAVDFALRKGTLVRQPCACCGNPDTEAHHDSYHKEDWLKVRWLCKQHHSAWHRLFRVEEPTDYSRALGPSRRKGFVKRGVSKYKPKMSA